MHKIRMLHQNLWIANLQRVTCVFRLAKRFHSMLSAQSHMEIFVNGIAESIAKSGLDGVTPASTRLTPSMATMAPLSVHSLSCGTRTSTPCSASNLQQFGAKLRIRRRSHLPQSTSSNRTAHSRASPSWRARSPPESANDAHTSSTGISLPCACCPRSNARRPSSRRRS